MDLDFFDIYGEGGNSINVICKLKPRPVFEFFICSFIKTISIFFAVNAPGMHLVDVSLASNWSAGLKRFRQPPVLVSHWLGGFAICAPTHRKITNTTPTSIRKAPATS
jgi:hypothetical protein